MRALGDDDIDALFYYVVVFLVALIVSFILTGAAL